MTTDKLVERLLDELVRNHCGCDVKHGYTCTIHEKVSALREALAAPQAPVGALTGEMVQEALECYWSGTHFITRKNAEFIAQRLNALIGAAPPPAAGGASADVEAHFTVELLQWSQGKHPENLSSIMKRFTEALASTPAAAPPRYDSEGTPHVMAENWQSPPLVDAFSHPVAPAAPPLRAGLRDRLITIQLEHETQYENRPSGAWLWNCKCGASDQPDSWEGCHQKTREHWADIMLAALAEQPAPADAALDALKAAQGCPDCSEKYGLCGHHQVQLDCAEQPAPAPERTAGEPVEVAWLIEHSGLCVGVCNQSFVWVTFTNEDALRFARKRDAEAFKAASQWNPALKDALRDAVITEHSWAAASQSGRET